MVKSKAQKTVEEFHRLYYNLVPRTQKWFGYDVQKCPLDLWIYHELIIETRPEIIIETGTFAGGSALFMAMVLDVLAAGEIYTIDTTPLVGRPVRRRIHYIEGSSTDPKIVEEMKSLTEGKRTMVVLDSDHSEEHVTQELENYAPMVSQGGFLIVEDTNTTGPVMAVKKFVESSDQFIMDKTREKFMLTFNPNGYLKKAW